MCFLLISGKGSNLVALDGWLVLQCLFSYFDCQFGLQVSPFEPGPPLHLLIMTLHFQRNKRIVYALHALHDERFQSDSAT